MTSIRYYTNTKELLSVCLNNLIEVYNSIFLSSLKGEGFGSTIWKQEKLIFALFVKDGNMFVSYEPGIERSCVELLVEDFLKKSIPVSSLEAYEPVAEIIVGKLQKLELWFRSWSYDIKCVNWSDKSVLMKQKSKLELASLNDLELIVDWTKGFFQDINNSLMGLNIHDLCFSEIENKNVYLLYYEGIPVTMTWKRRPLIDGCSIGFVFTPLEYRRNGYAAVCVSMVTEVFLKEFKYVTLFARGDRDKENNLYTSVGYQFIGQVRKYAAITE